MPRSKPARMSRSFHNQVIIQVNEALNRIKENASSDPEAAHASRTALYEFALRVISKGYSRSSAIATKALKASRIKFKWEATA